jgi:hypothetical protein
MTHPPASSSPLRCKAPATCRGDHSGPSSVERARPVRRRGNLHLQVRVPHSTCAYQARSQRVWRRRALSSRLEPKRRRVRCTQSSDATSALPRSTRSSGESKRVGLRRSKPSLGSWLTTCLTQARGGRTHQYLRESRWCGTIVPTRGGLVRGEHRSVGPESAEIIAGEVRVSFARETISA